MKLLKGFTLVELLVVMAIISFLSVGAFAGLSYGLRQARDVQRKKIADLANTAFQAYYSDYASYPKTAAAACAGNTVPGSPNWYFCTGAFPKTTSDTSSFVYTAGTGGIKDYLEGEWPTGSNTSDPGTGSDRLRYYYYSSGGASAIKFAVCISLENVRGGNVQRATGEKDCYCTGNDYQDLKCYGMTRISN